MNSPLTQGLWGVLATPFDDDLDVDLASLRNEVASFAADGCDGLVALGVFGEAASLRADEADAVAHTVASSTDLPYVLGTVRTGSRCGRVAGAATARQRCRARRWR